jgi:hypothetical protein
LEYIYIFASIYIHIMNTKVLKSGFGSVFTVLVYFILAFFLDKKINHKTSNLIALIITSVLNFAFQSSTFLNKSLSYSHFLKYIAIAGIEIFINQTSFSYLLNRKKDIIKFLPLFLHQYYNTIVRSISQFLVFFFISYPFRKYWIFV